LAVKTEVSRLREITSKKGLKRSIGTPKPLRKRPNICCSSCSACPSERAQSSRLTRMHIFCASVSLGATSAMNLSTGLRRTYWMALSRRARLLAPTPMDFPPDLPPTTDSRKPTSSLSISPSAPIM
jgi:hypothetical protein